VLLSRVLFGGYRTTHVCAHTQLYSASEHMPRFASTGREWLRTAMRRLQACTWVTCHIATVTIDTRHGSCGCYFKSRELRTLLAT
jgi:hypothetical protein